jgi:hypothetical protein
VLNEGVPKHFPFSLGPYDAKTDILDVNGEYRDIASENFELGANFQGKSRKDDVRVQISEVKEVEENGQKVKMVKVEVDTGNTVDSEISSSKPELQVSHLILRRNRNKERLKEINNEREEDEYQREKENSKEKESKEKDSKASKSYSYFIPSSFRTTQYTRYESLKKIICFCFIDSFMCSSFPLDMRIMPHYHFSSCTIQ